MKVVGRVGCGESPFGAIFEAGSLVDGHENISYKRNGVLTPRHKIHGHGGGNQFTLTILFSTIFASVISLSYPSSPSNSSSFCSSRYATEPSATRATTYCWLTCYDQQAKGNMGVVFHAEFAAARERLRDWVTSGSRLDRDRATRITPWPGGEAEGFTPTDSTEYPVENRNEDFVPSSKNRCSSASVPRTWRSRRS